jgi:hypothetical protein
MKRHGEGPNLPSHDPRGGVFRSQALNCLTHVLLAGRKFDLLSTKSSLNLGRVAQKICARLRPYATLLLTMIKIVLIAAISFASLNQ